jgi:hypothetical protein
MLCGYTQGVDTLSESNQVFLRFLVILRDERFIFVKLSVFQIDKTT